MQSSTAFSSSQAQSSRSTAPRTQTKRWVPRIRTSQTASSSSSSTSLSSSTASSSSILSSSATSSSSSTSLSNVTSLSSSTLSSSSTVSSCTTSFSTSSSSSTADEKKADSKEAKEKVSLSASSMTESTGLSALTQDREKLFRPFELLLDALEKKLKAAKTMPFKDLYYCVETGLALLEADIYPESKRLPLHPAKTKKIALIQDVFERVFHYFKNEIDATEVAKLAFLFAQRSLKYEYDYLWLNEERQRLAKEMIDFLIDTMNFLATGDRQLSTASIAKMIYALASFHANYPHRLRDQTISELIQKAERLHDKKRHFTVQQAFRIMDGISRFYVQWDTSSINSKHAEFFVILTTKALPMLLTVVEPLKMFSSLSLMRFRINRIKKFLPPVFDYSNRMNMALYLATTQQLLASHGKTDEEKIFDHMSPQLFSHRELHQKLNEKEAEVWEAYKKSEGLTAIDEEVPEEPGYRNRYPLSKLAQCIKCVYAEKNPRGTAWLIEKFAENLLTDLTTKEKDTKESRPDVGMNFHPKDIMEFLKVIRNYAFSEVVFNIAPTVTKLCQQAFNPYNFKIIDNDLAIELLWINMIFHVLTEGEVLAFKRPQQKKLCKKITTVPGPDQARALFEIQAMKWNGGKPFTVQISQQMQKEFKEFSKSSSPSYEEKECFSLIGSFLHSEQKQYLSHDHICHATGMEIDIAYVSPRQKVALHIDGPHHYHEAFKLPTVKTLFRNACLKRAKWRSFNVDITLPKTNIVKQLQEIIAFLREEIEPEEKSDQSWRQNSTFTQLFAKSKYNTTAPNVT